jgi:hypothetical protein
MTYAIAIPPVSKKGASGGNQSIQTLPATGSSFGGFPSPQQAIAVPSHSVGATAALAAFHGV